MTVDLTWPIGPPRKNNTRKLFQNLPNALVSLSFDVTTALSAMVRATQAHRLGHDRVGTEDLLWALFQKTDRDSRARHWLGYGNFFRI